jgi:transcriptional regulator with XRE-family HTH domain
MGNSWPEIINNYRLRYGLTQAEMAAQLNVAQRTVSRWERGEDSPGMAQKKRLRDLGLTPPDIAIRNLALAVSHCPAPRALSRTARLNLVAVSEPAIRKRPSITKWIGEDLLPMAEGVLQHMLDDSSLQKAIRNKEIAGVITVSDSVLRTQESSEIGRYKTTITYFYHDNVLYSDAIAAPVANTEPTGYTPIPCDLSSLEEIAVARPAEPRQNNPEQQHMADLSRATY